MNIFTNHDIMLTGTQISDLFFNHRLTNVDEYYDTLSEDSTQEDLDMALLADAEEFVELFLMNCSPSISSGDLVEDFKSRV